MIVEVSILIALILTGISFVLLICGGMTQQYEVLAYSIWAFIASCFMWVLSLVLWFMLGGMPNSNTIECREYKVEQRITTVDGQPTDTTYVITYKR